MLSAGTASPENAPKKPTITESVEDFISRKKSERGQEGAQAVQASAEGVQREVADVMAGAEKPKEGISEKSEKKSEQKGGGVAGATGATPVTFSDDDWKSISKIIKKHHVKMHR